jgi:integrase
MHRADIKDGVWRVPSEERQKGVGGDLVLPQLALDIIQAQPRIAGNPFVLAGRGSGPFNGMSKAKVQFDKLLPAMPRWTPHDLRRTARSLMSRAGVSSEHAERVLGHTIKGVEGTYDLYGYKDEKRIALEKLAQLVAEILNPPTDNKIVPLRAAQVAS